jgi:hypothetical protein
MKRQYKRLSLKEHFCLGHFYYVEELLDEGSIKPCTPIFNKNGWFYDRFEDVSWIEFDGKAYVDENSDRFKRKVYSFKLLRKCELDSIKVLVDNKILKNENPLWKCYCDNHEYLYHRSLMVETRISVNRMRK